MVQVRWCQVWEQGREVRRSQEPRSSEAVASDSCQCFPVHEQVRDLVIRRRVGGPHHSAGVSRSSCGVVEAAAVQARRLVIVSQDLPPILEGSIHRRVPSDGPRHQTQKPPNRHPEAFATTRSAWVVPVSRTLAKLVEDDDMVVQFFR